MRELAGFAGSVANSAGAAAVALVWRGQRHTVLLARATKSTPDGVASKPITPLLKLELMLELTPSLMGSLVLGIHTSAPLVAVVVFPLHATQVFEA